LTGQIRSLADEPIPGITVTLEAPGVPARTAVTNSEGRYAFGGLSPAEYNVTTAEFPYRAHETVVRIADQAVLALDIVLPISERFVVPTCNCNPLMDEPRTVKARDIWLVDPVGQPVPGVRIAFGRDRAETTDAGGHVCVEASPYLGFSVADSRFKQFSSNICCLPADGRITVWP
jgi:hypothetical protein